MNPVLRHDEKVFDDGYFRIEHENYYVTCGGEFVRFSRVNFLILSRLAQNPYRIVSSEALWACVHRRDQAPFNIHNLRVHIYQLRQALEPFGLTIEAMTNTGYRLLLKNNGKSSVGDDHTE